MSVDDRLRHAFGSTDTEWERAAPAALRAVTTRRHRERLIMRGGAAALAAAAAVAVVAVVGSGRGDDAAPAPVVPPPTTPAHVDEPPPNAARSVLEGRWRTALLDEDDVRAALEQSGDGQYADRILPALTPVPFRLVWLVTYETAELRVVSEDGPKVLDKTTLAVDGNQVTLAPRFADGATVHRFALSDDKLRLTFVSTTEPTADGVPGEVWQRLLYGSFELVRQ